MKDEIKEILELYKDKDIEYYNLCSDLGYDKLLDCITNLQEEKNKYKNVIDKIKEYVNEVIIDETYTNYINELLEEIE